MLGKLYYKFMSYVTPAKFISKFVIFVLFCSGLGLLAQDRTIEAPRLTMKYLPVYPQDWLEAEFGNRVYAEIVVNDMGEISDISIVSSPHQDFTRAVRQALRKWRFIPGKLEGKSINFNLACSFSFIPGDRRREPQVVLEWFDSPGDFPVEVDSPVPILTHSIQPCYPFELLTRNEKGEAEVTFTINAIGKLTEVDVDDSSDKAFGYAAACALAHWKFQPARKEGKRVESEITHTFRFDPDMIDLETRFLADRLRRGNTLDLTHSMDLDEEPRPIKTVEPRLPSNVRENLGSNQVVVEFIIDKYGEAILAHAIDPPDPWFGQAAESAVNQWKFEVITKDGEPTQTRVRLPVVLR